MPGSQIFITMLLCASLFVYDKGSAQCTLDLGSDTVYCGNPFVLDAGSGYQNYLWSTGATTSSININAVGVYALTVTSVGENIVYNGDFELGNTGFFTNYIYNATSVWNEGTYWVGPNAAIVHSNFVGTDHTPPPGVNFMVINGSGIPGTVVWSQEINVIQGIDYIFSAWISTLVASNPAQLQFYINGIPLGPVFSAPPAINQWIEYFQIWNSGGNTTATISLVNQTTVLSGNDFGVDDIFFAPVIPCVDTIFVYPSNLAGTLDPLDVACKGESTGEIATTISGGYPDYSYDWSNGQTGSTLVNVPAGNYSLTLTDEAGCFIELSAQIDEPLTPLEFGHTATAVDCNGNQNGAIDLWVNGGSFPYTYDWGFSTQQDVSGLSGGTYTVSILDDAACLRVHSVTVSEPDQLEVNLDYQDLSCAGDTNGFITSNATGGVTPYHYQWNTGQGAYAITNLGAGTYVLTLSDANACQVTESVQLTEPAPILLYTSADQTICLSQEAQIVTNAIGGVPPYKYFWDPGGLGSSQLVVRPERSTEYCVHIVDANQCKSNFRCVSIEVLPPLELDLSISDDSICRGDTIYLDSYVTGGNGGPYVLELQGSGAIGNSSSYVPQNSEHVVVYAYDGCGTPAVFESNFVLVSDPPDVSFKSNLTAGCPPLAVSFTNNNDPVDGYTYFWEFDESAYHDFSYERDPEHLFRNPGVYDIRLTITNEFGCSRSVEKQSMIEVYPKPEALFSSNYSSVDMLNPVITFLNQSIGGDRFYWQFGDGDSAYAFNPLPHSYPEPGNYWVSLIAENIFACRDTNWMKIEVDNYTTAYVPNAISVFSFIEENRVFKPIGRAISPEGYFLQVFNRWGEKIFESNHPDHGWDGRLNGGDLAPPGSYAYRLRYLDFQGKPYLLSGNMNLIY